MFAISNTNWFSFKRANIQMKRNSFDPSNSIYQYLKDFFVFQLNSNPWQSNRWLITCYCLVAMHRSRKMKHGNWTFIMHFNPLMFSVTFLYPLKTSDKCRFSDNFRVSESCFFRKRTVVIWISTNFMWQNSGWGEDVTIRGVLCWGESIFQGT